MKKLHLVGLSTDQRNLIFSTRRGSKSGAFTVEIDDEVLQAVEQRLRTPQPPAPGVIAPATKRGRAAAVPATVEFDEILGEQLARARQDSSLSVRDIQARLRRGRRLDEVAAEAGVSREWVARFAAPVLAEQAAVVDELRGATFATPRKGRSGAPVVDSVGRNLVERGVADVADLLEHGWRAHQLEGDEWMVRFEYHSRGRDQVAEWRLQRRTGHVRALNRLAADLAFVSEESQPAAGLVPPPPALRTRPKTAAASLPSFDLDETGAPLGVAQTAAGASAVSKARSAKKGPRGKQSAAKRTTAGRAGAKRASGKRAATGAKSARPARKPAAKKAPSTTPKAAPSRRTSKRAVATSKATQRGSSKPSSPKAAASKRIAASKSTTKQASATRPAAKVPTRRTATNPPAKRSTTGTRAKTSTATSPTSRKTTAKRATAKRATAKRATAKRPTAKRPTAPTRTTEHDPQPSAAPRRPDIDTPVAATESSTPTGTAARPLVDGAVPYIAEPAAPSNGHGDRGAAAPLLSSEDPFAALDLSAGFSPSWHDPVITDDHSTPRAAPTPPRRRAAQSAPRPRPAPAPKAKLQRTEWPPPRTTDRGPQAREVVDSVHDASADGAAAPGPPRRRAPLRAER